MNKRLMIGALASSLSLVSMGVLAEEERAVGVSAKVGTLGLGAELTVPLTSQFNARVGLNSYKYSRDIDGYDLDLNGGTATADLDADLKLNSGTLLLDWHPFAEGTFRLSAGYVFNNNSVDLEASLDNAISVDIGGNTYTVGNPDDRLSGDVEVNNGPYIGLGWGRASGKGWGFSADIGAVYQGEPSADLSVSGSSFSGLSAAQQAQLEQDLAAEETKLEDDISGFKWYPVASIGVSYGFSL